MAEDAELGKEIRKVEKNSLQKFKNQNKVLKKFGKVGLKVYRSIRKKGISIEELMGKAKLEQEKLFEILMFLKEKGMIETVVEAGPGKIEVEEEAAMAKPEGPIKARPKGKKKKKGVKEEKGALEKKGEEEEKRKPGKKVKKERQPAPATIAPEEETEEGEEGKIEPVREEAPAIAPEAEIKPEEEEELTPEEEFGIGKGPEEKEVEIPEVEEEGGIVPLELKEEEEEEPEQEEEEGPEKPEEPEEESYDDEISPSERKEEEEEPEEEDEDIFLTPGEKKIKAKYGQVGIDVYNLIDGQRTAEQIMKSTGVTETKLIEMLDFMEKKGIIKLEHPGTKRKKKRRAPKMPKVKEVGFAPMLEEGVSPEKPLGGELGKEFTLDVPSKLPGNMLREIQMKANLMIKFKKPGAKAFELMNGSRDAVEIALKTGLPLYRVYKVMAYLQREGMVKLEPSTREEIKRKYGEDGYSVYKRYGRDGVMLYQLIGKDMDLKQMADLTSEDKKRVVEIFMFIHRLLGIELPIDEDVLLERIQSAGPVPK
ncbi:hypothetical protein GF412_04545 [Candidatus Micrarchaeota archaeon]|nr:hypothetical protein [Candidatus Micrarchaeota archaeon]MBD3418221.1 hypothetical protein [Candidatus Micrarchaeota archaeon]